MAITAQDIIDEVSSQLNDENLVTWTAPQQLRYITSAQEVIVSFRPDAYSVIENYLLSAGSRQDIPADALRLLDIKRNMGTDGNTPGRPVNAIDEQTSHLFELTEELPQTEIVDFSYDERVPNYFYVYPPSNGLGYVEVAISRVPPKVDATTDTLVLKDIYRQHIVSFCMYRAYQKEIDSVRSQDRAQTHLRTFFDLMGIKFTRDIQFTPSVELSDVVANNAG